MQINFDKIRKIYGDSMLEEINNNILDVNKNIKYLFDLNFTDIEDILERYPYIFLDDFKIFKNKIDNLIKKLGSNYVEILETKMELWEKIYD